MADAFEHHAAEYDDWFERYELVYRSEVAAVEACLPQTGRGIEIGVGTGRFAGPLGINLGVEPALAMAVRAQNRGIQVVRGSAEALPIATAALDFALMVTVLCFLTDPLPALKEASRILKPGGRLIIGLIDPDSPLGRSYEANKAKSTFYRQARFLPIPQVLNWLAELGYGNPEIRQTVFQAWPDGKTPEPVLPGYGAGAFIVIAARQMKNRQTSP